MDAVTIAALLSPCLPALIKVGGQTIAHLSDISAKVGGETWELAQKVWDKLYPALVEKEDAKLAAEQAAAKPESSARQAVFQEELAALLADRPNLVAEIAALMQANAQPSQGLQLNQTIETNSGQATNQGGGQTIQNSSGQTIGQMSGGQMIGHMTSPPS